VVAVGRLDDAGAKLDADPLAVADGKGRPGDDRRAAIGDGAFLAPAGRAKRR